MNRLICLALTTIVLAGCSVQRPLEVGTDSLPAAALWKNYKTQLTALGTTQPVQWTLVSGHLPPGVSLSDKGVISGTPLSEGEFDFTVQVSESQLPTVAARSSNLKLKVKRQSAAGPLAISTTALAAGTVQVAYSSGLAATGGTTPYKWSVAAGTLPAGIVLNSSTGGLAGTPTTSGQFSFTADAQDSSAPPEHANQTLTLTIESATSPLRISSTGLPGGAVQVAYTAVVSATGGTSPYSWGVIGGTFPAGLALNGSSGAITGTPTQAGTFLFTLQVKDSAGQTASSSFSANIAPPASPVVGSFSPTSGPTSGGTAVTINGSNFAAGAAVSFGGVAASSVALISVNQIQAVAPAHIAGTVDISVQENGQIGTSTAAFTYNALTPTVRAISPNSGGTAGGTTVTITGTNFLAGALVLFGTVSAQTVSVGSGTQIQAVTPPNAAGVVDVTVENPGNLSGKMAGAFTYNPSSSGPLTISAVSPTSGEPGTQVTITGANFTTADTVSFGSTNASSTTFVNANQLTAQVPSIAAGAYSVTVTDPDPASATLNNSFTVTAIQAQSLLAGCTVSESSNVPSCAAPSGWTIVAAEGFGGGTTHLNSQLAGQISTAKPHTGSYALGGLYSSDGQVISDYVMEPSYGSYNDLYVSYWDWEDANALIPQELYIIGIDNCDQGTCPSAYQEVAWDWQNTPGQVNACASMTDAASSIGAGGRTQIQYISSLCINAGSWRQYEIWFHPNTVTSGVPKGDGFLRLYVNGQLSQSSKGLKGTGNENGVFGTGGTTPTMQNSNGTGFLEIAGVITAFCNSSATQRANPFSICPSNAPTPFHRYIDDIVIMKK